MAHTGLFVAPVAGTPPVGMSPTDGRLVLGAVFGTTAQLVSGGAFTPSATAMTATVAQAVWQTPDVTNGAATFLSPTDLTNLTFSAAPGTGGRIDLVCVKQNNVENSDADSRANVFIVQGTASGTPTAPATPAGASVYLQVLISAGQTNLAAATVTNYMQTTYRAHSITAPSFAALSTYTGVVGQHATVTADPTPAFIGDYTYVAGTGWVPWSCYGYNTLTPGSLWTANHAQARVEGGRVQLNGNFANNQTISSVTIGYSNLGNIADSRLWPKYDVKFVVASTYAAGPLALWVKAADGSLNAYFPTATSNWTTGTLAIEFGGISYPYPSIA